MKEKSGGASAEAGRLFWDATEADSGRRTETERMRTTVVGECGESEIGSSDEPGMR